MTPAVHFHTADRTGTSRPADAPDSAAGDGYAPAPSGDTDRRPPEASPGRVRRLTDDRGRCTPGVLARTDIALA